MNELDMLADGLEPEEAAARAAQALKQLLPLLDEGARARCIMNLLGDDGQDKIASMVHL
jgi:hypothetical protein